MAPHFPGPTKETPASYRKTANRDRLLRRGIQHKGSAEMAVPAELTRHVEKSPKTPAIKALLFYLKP